MLVARETKVAAAYRCGAALEHPRRAGLHCPHSSTELASCFSRPHLLRRFRRKLLVGNEPLERVAQLCSLLPSAAANRRGTRNLGAAADRNEARRPRKFPMRRR